MASGEREPAWAADVAARPRAGAPGRTPRLVRWARMRATRLGLGGLPHDGEELESLVGRYGTVALAALLILMGVGAFLTWAIANFTIGPVTRVGLGLVLAAVLGAVGWRLRTRGDDPGESAADDALEGASGTRRFGDVLLVLALAVVHVDAWGAGPYLGLISPEVALGLAALASGAMTLLAWRARDQALFVVGIGGALVAPFVTSVGPDRPIPLALYGWLVLTVGLLALPRAAPPPEPVALPGVVATITPRPVPRVRWAFGARVLGLGCAAYVAALLDDASAVAVVGNPAGLALPGWTLRRDAPALFALACSVGALALGGRTHGAGLALGYLVSTMVALFGVGLATTGGAPSLLALALAAAVAVQVAVRRLVRDADAADPPPDGAPRRRHGRAALAALLLPLGTLGAALVALPELESPAGAAAALAWAALSGAAAFLASRAPREGRTRRPLGAHLAAAGLASALAPVLAIEDEVTRLCVLAAHGAAFALLFGRVRERLALLAPLVVLGGCVAGTALLLHQRPAFAYRPFLTPASLCALAVVVALAVLGREGWRARAASGRPILTVGERGALVALAPFAALLWGREELAHAVSPDVATFLLVGYFAATGIVAISVGRARRAAGARQVGLALAIYAALKALAQASGLAAVGLRVGSYLLVGVFLLAVGYWYRSAGARPRRAETPAPG